MRPATSNQVRKPTDSKESSGPVRFNDTSGDLKGASAHTGNNSKSMEFNKRTLQMKHNTKQVSDFRL